MSAGDHDLGVSTETPHARPRRPGLMSCILHPPAGVRRVFLIGYWLGIFLLTHWPRIEDFPRPSWLFPHFDLVVHFCLYAGWTAACVWMLAGEGRWPRRGAGRWVAAGGAAYGIFDELTQHLVGRGAEVGDFLADMTGVVMALLLLGWWSRRLKWR